MFLPPRMCSFKPSEATMKKNIQTIMEIGNVSFEIAKNAYNKAYYNSNRAIEYILYNDIPKDIQITKEECIKHRDMLATTPCEVSEPTFSKQEIQEIIRIRNNGYPWESIIQIYDACDRDPILTEVFLSEHQYECDSD